MALAFGPIIAGPYSGTYNAVDVGFTLDGWKYGFETMAEMINQSDLYGDTLFDMVYRGSNGFLNFTSRTFKAGAMTPFNPWGGGTLGKVFAAATPIGRLARDVAASMVLTVIASTPAAGSTPAVSTFTASLALLAPNTRAELLFDSKARSVPISLLLLPSEVTSGVLAHAVAA